MVWSWPWPFGLSGDEADCHLAFFFWLGVFFPMVSHGFPSCNLPSHLTQGDVVEFHENAPAAPAFELVTAEWEEPWSVSFVGLKIEKQFC